jgi:hypothetical protein
MKMTAALARKLWHYNPETGTITWKVSPNIGVSVGDVAGTITMYGYRVLCFKKKKYRAARIAWLIMKGKLPIVEIDHEDRNPANDKWGNLREATSGQNTAVEMHGEFRRAA